MELCLVFGFLLYLFCNHDHTALGASALLSLGVRLSSPKRSVISNISWLLAWEYCSWTCVIYPRICKAASCLGNKYLSKYGWKIGIAYSEVGRAAGILGKTFGANITRAKEAQVLHIHPMIEKGILEVSLRRWLWCL